MGGRAGRRGVRGGGGQLGCGGGLGREGVGGGCGVGRGAGWGEARGWVRGGEGGNDAPALATGSVGIARGEGGTDVALETADVVLMSSDLSKLPFTITLGRKAARIVRQNVIFSVSVIATLVTLTIVAPLVVEGFRMPLPLGVVGHEGSTLIFVLHVLRLLAMKPK